MNTTAQEIYRRLIEEDHIKEVTGQITFDLASVNIIVKQRDVVGNIIQEWLAGWMTSKGISYRIGENSQMPPDFFLGDGDEAGLLEVKAFNRSASPAFDIADFLAYQRELLSKPYMLHVDYLIFGYEMTADGKVLIKDLWLKKVWEISRRMKDWPLNLQVKQGRVQKIRPCVWYSTQVRNFTPFRCLEDFISAIEHTVYQNPETRQSSAQWLNTFLSAYQKHYGVKLKVPRWDDIKESYEQP